MAGWDIPPGGTQLIRLATERRVERATEFRKGGFCSGKPSFDAPDPLARISRGRGLRA